MVRVCEEDFPKGSKKGQKMDGFYLEDLSKENIGVLAEVIKNDMQFTMLISGSGWVRVGKSVLAQQLGYWLTSEVNKLHNLNNKFTVDNVVFNSDKMIKKAFELPPYSVLVLDEGDDLTEHYWGDLAKNLRRFFRKCGQLNLIIILLIPDFFELPKPYAITRSVCLLDVHFKGKFKRGYFNFYNFNKKRKLYIKGRKTSNYYAEPPNFSGKFTNFYAIDEEAYRAKKVADLRQDNIKDKPSLDEIKFKKKVALDFLSKIKDVDGVTQKAKSEIINVATRTIRNYETQIKNTENG